MQTTDSSDPLSLFIGILVIVLGVYLVVKIIIKFARGDIRRSRARVKSRLKELEHDYRWRRIKVGYTVVTAIVAILIGSGAYGSSASSSFTGQGSASEGFWAMSATALVAWLIYRSFLPKLYAYLRPPEKPTDHSN